MTTKTTSMSVREMRCRIVLAALPAGAVHREEIRRIPRVAGWRPEVLDQALDDLHRHGHLVPTTDGRLAVQPRPGGTPCPMTTR